MRKDRNACRGGGVSVYYLNTLSTTQLVADSIPTIIENICFVSENLIYILLYIPPSASTIDVSIGFDAIVDCVDKWQSTYCTSKIVILGDFNKFSTASLCSALNLKNIVKSNTRKNSLLDCCFISKEVYGNYKSEVRDPLSNSDHSSVYIFANNSINPNINTKSFYDLRRSNINAFICDIENINWNEFFIANNVDVMGKIFTSNIQTCIKNIPTYTIKSSSNDKKWITPLCKHLINQRWKAYRNGNFDLYYHYQAKVKQELQKAKRIWVQNCKSNKMDVWSIVKKQAPKQKSSLESLKQTHENDYDLANRINSHLCKSFNTSFINILPRNQSASLIKFEELTVFHALNNLNVRKAPGSDNISNLFLRKASHVLAKPLSFLFNQIADHQQMPSLWKLSHISPIPKSKPPNIEKLRPISLLSTSSKIFERLFLDNLKPILLPLITPNQFGFMPQSSTSICLIKIQETVTKLLDYPSISAITLISFDLSRAFDTIPHSLLMDKLKDKVPSFYFNFLCNYLSDRFQCVKVNSSISSKLQILSGVPQGSILSPLLFNIFINDLSFESDCYLFKYADDTTVILPHFYPCSTKAVNQINTKITMMKSWCDKNGLKLNASKTQIMSIKKSRLFTNIPNSQNEMKILGVIFNNHMKWDNQVQYLIKKANKHIYLLKALKNSMSKSDLITIYKSKLESILDYGSCLYIYLPSHLKNRIDKVSKRCHNLICNFNCNCNSITLPSLLRIKRGINLFARAYTDPHHPLHDIIPPKLAHCNKFLQPKSASERRLKSFIPAITKEVNLTASF